MSDECVCDCHIPGHFAMHMTACCKLCSMCGKKIAIEKMDKHTTTCGNLTQSFIVEQSGILVKKVQALEVTKKKINKKSTITMT